MKKGNLLLFIIRKSFVLFYFWNVLYFFIFNRHVLPSHGFMTTRTRTQHPTSTTSLSTYTHHGSFIRRSSHVNHNLSTTSLLFIIIRQRGGATTPSIASSLDDNNNDYCDKVDIDIITDRAGNKAAQSARPMSNFAMDANDRFQLGKSYFLSAILWMSITMDVVNNKRKRCLIFPDVVDVGGRIASKGNLIQTITLALGFGVAASVAYLISNELKKDDGEKIITTATKSKDTYSSIDDSSYVFTNNENVRKKLHFFLFLFGITNLGANINPSSAPFLGMSGFVINAHNALIALNAWKKDTIVEGQTVKREWNDMTNMVVNVFTSWKVRDTSASLTFWQKSMSFMFPVVLSIAFLSGVNVIFTSLVPYYLTGMVRYIYNVVV